ncbi:hypothetical protein [Hymenobacter sp. APR13]|uniref:hypothetical protein n=1 Tax=Hymenobacter sp. APR13 TaxID=1356852 RepID=UPI0004E0917C|nr:hypothetical protein [Hymenobacter sp. APR13]AII51552.1 hypothetical protein N008_06095 [Hymenobacter sp. APR13]
MKMKAYPLLWATQEAMEAAAPRWFRRQLLTDAQYQAIKVAYQPDFYRPGLLLRIGLVLFTCVGVAGAAAFLALFGAAARLEDFRLLGWALALGCLGTQEVIIREFRHYRSGTDSALLYIGLFVLALLLAEAADHLLPPGTTYASGFGSPHYALLLLPMLGLLLLATLRYADRLVAAATYLVLLALLANWLLQLPIGRLLLPFALMLMAVAVYQILQRWRQRPDYLYYRACLIVLEVLALATFYLAGNYYMVREGNAEISGLYQSVQVPLAPLFYLFTAIIPLVYIAVGLRKRSRLWLLMGLAAVAFSLFTLRYYRSVLPPEMAAVLAGTFLLALAVWAARYLRPARHGLTSLADAEQPTPFNLESLVVAQTAQAPTAPTPGFEFGGGHSGGGGADGSY